MGDLISRKALIEEVERRFDGMVADMFCRVINLVPSVDTAEVVSSESNNDYCHFVELGDCPQGGCSECMEKWLGRDVQDDNDFCSYGERKEKGDGRD